MFTFLHRGFVLLNENFGPALDCAECRIYSLYFDYVLASIFLFLVPQLSAYAEIVWELKFYRMVMIMVMRF